jgi:hypothetical protein
VIHFLCGTGLTLNAPRTNLIQRDRRLTLSSAMGIGRDKKGESYLMYAPQKPRRLIIVLVSVCYLVSGCSGSGAGIGTPPTPATPTPAMRPIPIDDESFFRAFALVIRARGKEPELLSQYGATDPRNYLLALHRGSVVNLRTAVYRELVVWSVAGVICHKDWASADASAKKAWSEEGLSYGIHRWHESGYRPDEGEWRQPTWDEAREEAANYIACAQAKKNESMQDLFSLFGINDEAIQCYCKETGRDKDSLSIETIQDILIWSLAGLLRHADYEDATSDVRNGYIRDGIRCMIASERSLDSIRKGP